MKTILSYILFIFLSNHVLAFDFKLQPGELKYLPKYCASKLDPKNHTDGLARTLFGHENSMHMHHYCAGLAYILRGDRAIGMEDSKRRFLYERGVAEIGYLEQRMTSDFRIKYEMYYQKGYALSKVGRDIESVGYFLKAIDNQPKYIKAHRALFDFYFDSQQFDEARKTITRALEIAPNSSSLKRRLRKLGNVKGNN